MDAVKNFAKATVTDGNYDDTSTEIDVLTGHGSHFPTAPFNAVWWNASDYPDPSDDPNVEIIRVTDVDTDTLTISRGQEGTAAVEHNLPGKTYQLIAGLTAHTIEDMVGDVFGSGPALLFEPSESKVTLRQDETARFVRMDGAGSEFQSEKLFLGDVEGAGNGTNIGIRDDLSRIYFTGQLATDQIASATIAVGTLAGKIPVRDASGTLIGYLPLYASIA